MRLFHRASFVSALVSWFALTMICYSGAHAQDSVCARVKIEIRQEMTLERQGFDAHMRINNGLEHIDLENLDVDVSFSDEDGNAVLASSDPNNTDALFFLSLASMDNISDVNGSGVVSGGTSADIHWTIIPAPGASNGLESGTLYYVGATLHYTINGEENETEVTPDSIYVKPMPELTLDYFLPSEVYGDDAFSQEIEPVVPFSLGVRVSNNGEGEARKLRIGSAQPKIVENEQGLLTNFEIVGSEVNGQPASESLLVDFGNIGPGDAGLARWLMTCSLSGKFVEFTAEYTHDDSLGGEMTSLLESVNTHFLEHEVLVTEHGRDGVMDFLAKDAGLYRVYESENTDTPVNDQSGTSSLTQTGTSGTRATYQLTTPVTAGFQYVRLSDPFGGAKVISEVVRSDGKRIKSANVWLSKTRHGDREWDYWVSLFDSNSNGSYTIVFDDPGQMPQPPVMQYIPDYVGVEGAQLSFIVEASDPDGTVPALSASPLPVLASFVDQGDGLAIFDWVPATGQSGTYRVTYSATDGALTTVQSANLVIYSAEDTDGDGMPDEWEQDTFGDLERDGSGDMDGDGISDKDEYLNGTDPTSSNAPSVPVIQSPADGAEVTEPEPELVIENSVDPDGEEVSYEYELYSDAGMTQAVSLDHSVLEGEETTSWLPGLDLDENRAYFWRVRATDGVGYSEWAYGTFFVNQANDAPGAFLLSSPLDGSETSTLRPELEVSNSVDADRDALTYGFALYADVEMQLPVTSISDVEPGSEGTTSWQVDVDLQENAWYYWLATATDEHGLATACDQGSFFVNTENQSPTAPAVTTPGPGEEVALQSVTLTVDNATDPDYDVLRYFFELDRVNTFDSPDRVASDAVTEGDTQTTFKVSGLQEDTEYFWRVKAADDTVESAWATASFFVNTENAPPSAPTVRNPGNGAWVETLTPTLELLDALDSDRDDVHYDFELFSDEGLTTAVASSTVTEPAWLVPSALEDNQWYFWQARAVDEHGAQGAWLDAVSFFVNNNGVDDPPEITLLTPAEAVLTAEGTYQIEWQDQDPDSNALISLYRDDDGAGEDGTLIAEGLSEDPDGEEDGYLWDMSTLEDGTYYLYALIADNTNSAVSYAPAALVIDRTAPVVQADPAGGTFSEAQSVHLWADESADIYYTVDGSEPTEASTLYSGPIEVAADTTVRFVAVDPAGNSSAVAAEDYMIVICPDEDQDGFTDAACGGADCDDSDAAMYPGAPEDCTNAVDENCNGLVDLDDAVCWEQDGDGDGLTDAEEIDTYGTNPFDADTDHDHLSDREELTVYNTNPLDDDTDGDGYHDGWEVEHNFDPADEESRSTEPVFEAGEVTLNHNWTTVTLTNTYTNPVVIAAPLSRNGGDPAVVRVRNAAAERFEIRIQEWGYIESQSHTMESVSYVVVEAGRYTLDNGTVMEAGTLSTGNTYGVEGYDQVSFTGEFATVPVLATTVMTFNGPDTVTTRERNITRSGFQSILQHEEASEQDHPPETVGYLACEAGTGFVGGYQYEVGQAGEATHGWHTVSYGTFQRPPVVIMDMQGVAGGNTANLRWTEKTEDSVRVQVSEEKSADSETSHVAEAVGFMAFLRPFAFEVGEVEINHTWTTVELAHTYTTPVVIAKPLSLNGGDPATVRIRNVRTGQVRHPDSGVELP